MISRFRFKRFRDAEHGSVPIEGLFGFMLVMGWFLLGFEIYDSFKIRGEATRAAVVISDVISRENQPIGPKYVNGIKKVYDFVAGADKDTSWIRVTLIKCWDDPDDPGRPCDGHDANSQVTMVESYATGNAQPQTQATLEDESFRIPILAAGDTATLVETAMQFQPTFWGGLFGLTHSKTAATQTTPTIMNFSNFVVTRPRGERLTWDDTK